MSRAVLYCGDVREMLVTLPDESVQCVVTSPPYWGLRDYGTGTWEGGDVVCDHTKVGDPVRAVATSTLGGGKKTTGHLQEGFKLACGKCGAHRVDNQLGLERTPEEYVANMVAVFREVRRVLRDDGCVFLNLGDSYAGGGGFSASAPSTASSKSGKYGTTGALKAGGIPLVSGLKQKDLVGVPWLTAFALRADGWYLRSDVIWSKPNPMPESVTDRPTKAHEYLFLLAKGQWKTSVIQFADLARERVQLGKHLRRSPANTWSGQVCVALASLLFDSAQSQQDFSLPPFYAEEWKQGADGSDRDFVRGLPPDHISAVWAARFLDGNATAEQFLRQVDSRSIALRQRDDLLISRASAESLDAPAFDADGKGTITVHHAGKVGKIEFSHDRIIVSSPTTCEYYYDAAAITEPAEYAVTEPGRLGKRDNNDRQDTNAGYGRRAHPIPGSTRNARSVWPIATQPYAGSHFACMPEELARRCIVAGSSARACETCGAPWERLMERSKFGEQSIATKPKILDGMKRNDGDRNLGGQQFAKFKRENPDREIGWEPTCSCEANTGAASCVVLDPFGGSGTTAAVAVGHGRQAIYVDLNPEYLHLAEQRIGPMLCDRAVRVA